MANATKKDILTMSDSVLGSFDLTHEITRFPPGETGGGRRAETLIKTSGLRVVLVTMKAGAALHEHTAPGPISIYAVQGSFQVDVESTKHSLSTGSLISIAAGVKHVVRALEPGAFLLTIGGTGGPAPVE